MIATKNGSGLADHGLGDLLKDYLRCCVRKQRVDLRAGRPLAIQPVRFLEGMNNLIGA